MQICPIIPSVPGVPALLNLPPQAVRTVNQGLDSCSQIMGGVSAAISFNPTAALSTVADQIFDAQNALGPVNNVLANFASPVLSPIIPSVAASNLMLDGISTVISGDPSGPVSMIEDAVGGVVNQLASSSRVFAGALGLLAGPLDILLGGDVLGFLGGAQQMQWGIYKDGQPVIEAESCVSMDYRKEWVVADYQQEEGAFASYDKVEMPYESRVRFATGGSVLDRQAFLDSIEAIAGDLELYDVVTPERVYESANVTHYDYRRTATQGMGLLQVDISLLEIRVTAEQDFTTTAAPSGAATQNGGTVQATTPNKPQQSALSELLGP